MELNKHFDYTDNYSEIVHTTRLISAEELTDRFFCAPAVDYCLDEVS